MAGASGSNSFVDDHIELSGKTDPNEYLKLFVTQQIVDRRGFIARIGPEVNIARNELGQLNALIVGLEASEDVGEAWDTIMYLRDEQRYHSEEYFDDAHEDDENNHSNGNVDIKKTQSNVFEFLGDMVREHIGLKILTWNKVGSEARDKQWDEIMVKSAAGKMARSKCLYPHTMGRGGYAHVKEQMIEKKEIKPDEEPSRGTLWLKGRVNKDGDYPDDEIRSVGDKLKETEDKKFKKETLMLITAFDVHNSCVLCKEKGGRPREGSDVTSQEVFGYVTSKQAADERILLLQSQLDAARRERQEKELLIQSMSSKMSQTEGLVTKLKTQLAAQGGQLQSMPTQLTPPALLMRTAGKLLLDVDQNDASIWKEMQKRGTV
ncbi:transposase, Ptta/En/Spm, transposase, Tnp1/En/Spm-like protein [Tanacetum coccineum]